MANLQDVEHFLGASTPTMVPSDSGAYWDRADVAGVPPGHVVSVLSTVAEGHQENSYLCNRLTLLSVTDHPAANQGSSESCGDFMLLFSPGSGTPWATGYHIETHHGERFASSSVNSVAAGCTLGFNCEIHRRSPKGFVAGLNIQHVPDGSSFDVDAGIQVQAPQAGSSFKAGIHLVGPMRCGVDTGGNDVKLGGGRLWLNGNTFAQLDSRGRLVTYRNGRPVSLLRRLGARLRGVSHPAAAPVSPPPAPHRSRRASGV